MAFYYRRVPEPEVESRVREPARMMLDHCKRRLGLDSTPIKISWVKREDETSAKIDMGLAELAEALRRTMGDYSEVEKTYHEERGEFWGQVKSYYNPENEILIRADIPTPEIMKTIAHECQHFADTQTYRPPRTNEEKAAWERRAEAFARRVMEEAWQR